jgi:type II secretory pathway pseudopilin PulG
MKHLIRKANSSSPSKPPQDFPPSYFSEPGYALIVLMIMATVLLISLAAALPSVYQEAQREREKELIFRGNQYARAVYLFHNQMGRYPVSVKELLSINGIRFLRRAYRDPMTPSGKWRFIHANAAGIPIDSRTQTLTPQNPANPGAGPSPPSAPTSSTGFGTGSSTPSAGLDSASSGPQNSNPSGGPARIQTPSPDCQNSQVPSTSGATEESNPILGTFIIGVASCSDHSSIMTYNKKSRYSDWEFLGTTYVVMGIPGAIAPPALQNPGQPSGSGQGAGASPASPSGPPGPAAGPD